jgi:chitinase
MISHRRARALGFAAVVLAAGMLGIAGPSADATVAPSGPVVAAYYAGWESGSLPVSQIPVDTITNLFYSFAGISDGSCTVPSGAASDFAALATLKRSHPKLRVSISIGGWGEGGFSDIALTDASRKKFVSSCLNTFFGTYSGSFDGVDIDWEFPVSGGPSGTIARPQDRQDATLLATEFRRQLDALGGEHHVLTAALPAGRLQTGGAYDPAASFDLAAMGGVLDWINLMTYAMGTGFSPASTFDAPMNAVPQDPLGQPMKRWNNVTGAVRYYEQHGVPADKIVLGVPFYGQGFNVAQEGSDHGLYQPYDSTFGVDTWPDVKALLADPAWQQYWNNDAQAPWLYNSAEHKFLSFEDPRSISIRSTYAKRSGLRGAFMWELSEDDSTHTMLDAMAAPW